MGAPKGSGSLKTQAVMDEIIDRLSEGETLQSICRCRISVEGGEIVKLPRLSGDGFPRPSTVYDWEAEDPDFSVRVARARRYGADAIANEALVIADCRAEEPASRKVRIETRLKLLACWDPRYSQKVQATVVGDAAAPIHHKVDATLSPSDAYRKLIGD